MGRKWGLKLQVSDLELQVKRGGGGGGAVLIRNGLKPPRCCLAVNCWPPSTADCVKRY